MYFDYAFSLPLPPLLATQLRAIFLSKKTKQKLENEQPNKTKTKQNNNKSNEPSMEWNLFFVGQLLLGIQHALECV